MPVPNVTFPLEQSQVKEAHDTLMTYLRGLQAEMRIVQEMLRIIPTFCEHACRTKYMCHDCGQSWGQGD